MAKRKYFNDNMDCNKKIKIDETNFDKEIYELESDISKLLIRIGETILKLKIYAEQIKREHTTIIENNVQDDHNMFSYYPNKVENYNTDYSTNYNEKWMPYIS